MKHAINELKMVLDIAKNNEPIQRAEGRIEQADLNAERMFSIQSGINFMEGYLRRLSKHWTSRVLKEGYTFTFFAEGRPVPEEQGFEIVAVGSAFEEPGYLTVVYKPISSVEQHRADMAETSREENANGGPEKQEIRIEHKDTGVPVVGFAQGAEEVPLQYQRCKHGTAFRYFCEECDDDLGELDANKACGFGEEGCSSCQ